MGDCHLIVYYRLVAILLLQHFTFKFERLDVISHVVEIDSCGFLLQKLYAFHTYLSKLILREWVFKNGFWSVWLLRYTVCFYCSRLFGWSDNSIDTTFLMRLICLSSDDLVKIKMRFPFLVDHIFKLLNFILNRNLNRVKDIRHQKVITWIYFGLGSRICLFD